MKEAGKKLKKTYSQKHTVEAALFIPVPPSVITT